MKIATCLENALNCCNDGDIPDLLSDYKQHVSIIVKGSRDILFILFKDMSVHVVDHDNKIFYTCEDVAPYLEEEWAERLLNDITNSSKHETLN